MIVKSAGHVIKHGESLQVHTDLPAPGDPKLTGTHPDIYTAANLILEFDGRCQKWVNVNLDPALLGLPSDLLFNGVPMTEGHRYKLENERVRRYRTLKDEEG
jgi:hypothetical protein